MIVSYVVSLPLVCFTVSGLLFAGYDDFECNVSHRNHSFPGPQYDRTHPSLENEIIESQTYHCPAKFARLASKTYRWLAFLRPPSDMKWEILVGTIHGSSETASPAGL